MEPEEVKGPLFVGSEDSAFSVDSLSHDMHLNPDEVTTRVEETSEEIEKKELKKMKEEINVLRRSIELKSEQKVFLSCSSFMAHISDCIR
jgi:hypothetical protein